MHRALPALSPMLRHLVLAFGLGAALLGAPDAHAQKTTPDASTFAAAFAGDWLIFDGRYATAATPCRIQLKAEGDPLAVITQDCHSAMTEVKFWRIEAGQLHLVTAGGLFARLGGTTARVSGWDKAGEPLVLDRDAGPALADPIIFARKTKGCWFVGYSDKCATAAQAHKPAEKNARICTVVDLKLRGEARPEASVVGVLPAQTCIETEVCATTATGPWCFIRFATAAGWARQYALRQEEWPVLTFVADEAAD